MYVYYRVYSLLSESAKNRHRVLFLCSLIGQILISPNLIGQIVDSFLKALCKEYTLSLLLVANQSADLVNN